jgi:DNA primase
MIPNETIDAIKQAMDIVEVISDFVSLKKSGQSYKANSPFTNEKTPSFFVTPSKQIFKCFSTGKGGDAITFVMEHEGFSYIEALKYIAQKYSIEIQEKEASQEEISQRTQKDSLFIALNFAKDFYKDKLHNHIDGKSIGLSYLKERGFTNDTIDKFDLGFSLEEWDALYKAGLKTQFSEEILEKAGLIIKKEDGKLYDRFRNRVMFPIHNLSGKVVAFGARILVNDKKQPKYINSPETEVYHKSNVLYGIFQAKNEIRNKENCYLVEGYTDVISMHQAGITNVVASSGTALTQDQIKLVHRYTENMTVLYDGDAAGIRASIRGIDLILEQGMNVYACSFPDGEDPDSYSRKIGGEQFEKYISDNKTDFISFVTKLYLAEAGDDPIKKAGVIRHIVESISLVPDALKRSVFFQKCSSLLKIDEQIIVSEYNKIVLKKRHGSATDESKQAEQKAFIESTQTPAETQERIDELEVLKTQEGELIRFLIQFGGELVETPEGEKIKLSKYILNELADFEFQSELYREIFDIYSMEILLSDEIDEQIFITSTNQNISQSVIDLISSKYEISKGWEKFEVVVLNEKDKLEKTAYLMLNRLKWRFLKWKINQNLLEIENAKDEIDLNLYLQKHQDYKTAEIQIAKILGNVAG